MDVLSYRQLVNDTALKLTELAPPTTHESQQIRVELFMGASAGEGLHHLDLP